MRSNFATEPEFPDRARVVWRAEDVQTIAEERGLDWDLKMCDDFVL